jgi:hypothetical protein
MQMGAINKNSPFRKMVDEIMNNYFYRGGIYYRGGGYR